MGYQESSGNEDLIDILTRTMLYLRATIYEKNFGFRTKTFDFRPPKNLDPIFLLLQKSNLVRISNPPKTIFFTQIWIFPPKISISPQKPTAPVYFHVLCKEWIEILKQFGPQKINL